jgi:hypothetical protein
LDHLRKWYAISILNENSGTNPWQIVEHHSAILNVPNEVTIGQHSDHREMARFISMRDRNFRPVLARLEKFREDIIQGVESSDYVQPGTQVSRPKGPFQG